MKFKIFRTSDYNYKLHGKPCEGAYEETVKCEEHKWITDENGKRIVQISYVDLKKWYIDISTVNELLKLRESVGTELIINEDGDGCYIEIYDTYRE